TYAGARRSRWRTRCGACTTTACDARRSRPRGTSTTSKGLRGGTRSARRPLRHRDADHEHHGVAAEDHRLGAIAHPAISNGRNDGGRKAGGIERDLVLVLARVTVQHAGGELDVERLVLGDRPPLEPAVQVLR